MAKSHYRALLGKVLLGFISEDDPVLAMLEWGAHQMMLIEAEGKVGAEKGKHSKKRKTYFSGTRVRRMDTRLGTICLYVPKLRKGGYVPFFVTERKRSEMALATLVQEAFINGVSTRRIERLAQALGVENISASQVSEINKGLEKQVESFRSRPLEEEYPFLLIDAHVLYELDVHLVVDNYATHKHARVRRWLAVHARFHVHLTPAYASWLNQVKIWFNALTQQATRRGAFRSVKDLAAKIDHIARHHNAQAQPFIWTATDYSILAKIKDYVNIFPRRNTRIMDTIFAQTPKSATFPKS